MKTRAHGARRLLLRVICIILSMSAAASLFSCADDHDGGEPAAEATFTAMDTVMTIEVLSVEDSADAQALVRDCIDIVSDIEKRMSRTLEDSEIYAFNHSEKGALLSDDTAWLIRTALEISELSDRAFDITVAPLVDLWDIKNAQAPPAQEDIDELLPIVGYEHLSFDGNFLFKDDPRVMIDLGAAAKGYALSAACRYLEENGVLCAVLNFGGNVGLIGKRSDGSDWRVGIKDPDSPSSLSGIYSVGSGAVSVSGDYERYFVFEGVRYHHILSPQSGYPASLCRSCAVYCADAVVADMLSTALFVAGKDGAEKIYSSGRFDFEYVIFTDDGFYTSPGASDSYEPLK